MAIFHNYITFKMRSSHKPPDTQKMWTRRRHIGQVGLSADHHI
jgi:hypothetical protein